MFDSNCQNHAIPFLWGWNYAVANILGQIRHCDGVCCNFDHLIQKHGSIFGVQLLDFCCCGVKQFWFLPMMNILLKIKWSNNYWSRLSVQNNDHVRVEFVQSCQSSSVWKWSSFLLFHGTGRPKTWIYVPALPQSVYFSDAEVFLLQTREIRADGVMRDVQTQRASGVWKSDYSGLGPHSNNETKRGRSAAVKVRSRAINHSLTE